MDAEQKKSYTKLLILTLIVLATGTVFYRVVEGLSWIDAYYFCVITLTTVGYGDITPQTALGKIFTTIYLFVGLGIITAFISARFRHRVDKHEARKQKKKQKKNLKQNHK